MIPVFQENCDRLFGPDNINIDKNIRKRIKDYYHINEAITITGLNNTRLNLEVLIKDFYLFNSLCVTHKNKLQKKGILTKEDISLICLEIVSRVLSYPKFYYTLINYNLPDKVLIKDVILSELLLMFNLSLDDLVVDKFLYYELGNWKLRGYRSLYNLFKYINYMDLILFDNKEQIINSLKNIK